MVLESKKKQYWKGGGREGMLEFVQLVLAVFMSINLIYCRFLHEQYPDHPDSIYFQNAHTIAALFALVMLLVI